MRARNLATARIAALAVVLAAGCRRAGAPPTLPVPEATAAGQPPAALPADPTADRDPTPPATRAELERDVTWFDRPVRDPLALAREQEALLPPPVPLAEALGMANDSPEANAAILAAILQPPSANAGAGADRAARHLVTDVDTLAPIRAESAMEFDVLGLTGVGLFGFDRGLEPFARADTVASWQSSADGLVDRVVLRDDLTWSDGRPITAHDVAFTWRLIVDPRVPARAFRDAARRLRDVRAYDDRTVVFFHEAPVACAVAALDFPLLPRHVYARTWEGDPTLAASGPHAALEARPVTGGPYEVAARTPGREIVLRRRAGWSTVRGRTVRAAPRFAEIRFRAVADGATALADGRLDEAVLAAEEWPTAAESAAFADRAVKVATPEWRSLQFAWNLSAPVFADRRVRRALGSAFDHGRLRDALGRDLDAAPPGIFPPGSWATAHRRPAPVGQDLDKAEALLDEAGWIDRDGDGVRDREIDGRLVPCVFTVVCDDRPARVEVCRVLEESLARVGVRCTVRAVGPRELRDLVRERRFEACLVSWGAGADPDAAASLWTTDGALNPCGYSNAEVDALFAAGRRERDREHRGALYARIEEILTEDQPCTWLAWLPERRGLARRVAGDAWWLREPAHWSPGLSSIWRPTLE